MGIAKKEGFDKKTLELAELTKALGHPARMAIIIYMIENPSCICNDIVDELPLAQSTISKHLTELKNVGLIKGEIEGSKLCYCINPDVWKTLKVLFNDLFQSYECKKGGCC
jgi:predicted transcriptional regulator